MSSQQAYYNKGYKKSISDTHATRTVDNSVRYITKVLKPEFKVLDVGCGPGSITIDIAKNYLTEGGSIIGVEPTKEIIDTANNLKQSIAADLDNISFQIGSIYNLPFEDNTFDLVHAHQVIVHLEDPIKALKELARVAKPGKFVTVKDGDLESMIFDPPKYDVLGKYNIMSAKNRGSTDVKSGRKLLRRAIEAGYKSSNITTSSSTMLFTGVEKEKRVWGELLIKRVEGGGEVLVADDEKKNEELKQEVVKTLKEWKDDETSLWSAVNFEITYKKPE
ncbi:Methyltransferase domain family protein [Candida parapsilosis]|uniref:Methyltranfer_dom domain-containing protein n=2 Tax=Candida parapsilosis TaxID=5480 RepID=G8B6J6_CANPC|nr:uncharacterized protein CPAR2_101160 [Candida parapsilosis]KAF6048056.1 Methyltransferase domain family protein [Candida parapsilosis]KAF6049977.1 Methyltransferase domain family protein [Candida parapsilosis]KAF6057840.1 Methyltransferase domain family protein [Candida parapsilosis]KAF6065453.1 Methyltransferase domain family protein [Candida parapsilosis]KAI5903406.1 putative methyltransferase C1B3.06c [Candida parapsilosis]